MTTRRLSTVTELPTQEMGGVFAARRPPFDVDLDPFLNIDLFHVTGIVFAPHPHAGFSAVTYLVDDSTTPIRNRDSLGDNGLIQPGGVHWTVAGSGIVHEEPVEHVGQLGHGARIFVRLPPEAEEISPSSVRYTADELPQVDLGNGAHARVVTGTLTGTRSPVDEPAKVNLFHLWLPANTTVEIPVEPTHRGFVMTIDGSARLHAGDDTGNLGPTGLAIFEPGDGAITMTSGPADTQLLVGAGQPFRAPSFRHGGFHFSIETALHRAIDRYQRGEMHGALAPTCPPNPPTRGERHEPDPHQ